MTWYSPPKSRSTEKGIQVREVSVRRLHGAVSRSAVQVTRRVSTAGEADVDVRRRPGGLPHRAAEPQPNAGRPVRHNVHPGRRNLATCKNKASRQVRDGWRDLLVRSQPREGWESEWRSHGQRFSADWSAVAARGCRQPETFLWATLLQQAGACSGASASHHFRIWSAVRAKMPNIKCVITLAQPRTRTVAAPNSSFSRAYTRSTVVRSRYRTFSWRAISTFTDPRFCRSMMGTCPSLRLCSRIASQS